MPRNFSHTPGPWVDGRDNQSIVSLNPDAGSLTDTERDYYGGKVICETVSGANKLLIKAAPELLACVIEHARRLQSMLASSERFIHPSHIDAVRESLEWHLDLIRSAGGDLND